MTTPFTAGGYRFGLAGVEGVRTRNIELALKHFREVIEDAEVAMGVPDDVTMVLIPYDDHELAMHNLGMAMDRIADGQAVFIKPWSESGIEREGGFAQPERPKDVSFTFGYVEKCKERFGNRDVVRLEDPTRGIQATHYVDVTIDPETIAYYAHCQSGMDPMAFVAWLCQELRHLNDIDPECSK